MNSPADGATGESTSWSRLWAGKVMPKHVNRTPASGSSVGVGTAVAVGGGVDAAVGVGDGGADGDGVAASEAVGDAEAGTDGTAEGTGDGLAAVDGRGVAVGDAGTGEKPP
jgi:hypothetical protein